METGFIILAITLVAGIGIVAYVLNTTGKTKTNLSKGVLHINYDDDDDEPSMFLTLNVPVEDIVTQKQILLSVNVMCENSQK